MLHRFVPGSPRLHYLEWLPDAQPSGVPVLMIHGFLSDARMWAPLAAALRTGDLRAAPRRCVAVDLRGRGDSEAPEQGYSVADHAADIARVVAAAGLQRCVLIAFSMGVAYGAAYAALQPGRIAGFVAGDYPARARSLGEEGRARYLAEPTSFPSWEAARQHFVSQPAFPAEAWDELRPELLRESPGGGVSRWYAAAAVAGLVRETDDYSGWDALRLPGTPLLALRGERGLLSERAAAGYAELGARLVVVPNCGHNVYGDGLPVALREIRDLLFWADMQAALR